VEGVYGEVAIRLSTAIPLRGPSILVSPRSSKIENRTIILCKLVPPVEHLELSQCTVRIQIK
jgi:hypothetical protein